MIQKLKNIKPTRVLINLGIISLFCILYYLTSITNHENFRTTAYDLGIYTNQMHHYLSFDTGNTVIYPNMKVKWADHFSLFQVIFAPLTYILGSYTLLYSQIFMIIIGGLGMKKITDHLTKNDWLSSISLFHFYSIWTIFAALSFDYHDNVIGAMIVPWFIYYFLEKKLRLSIFFLVCILLCKETMSLWMTFVSLMLLLYSKDTEDRKIALTSLIICLLYFVIVFFIVMPNLDSTFTYKHFNYKTFGNSFSELGKYYITHPIDSIKYLFVNHLSNPKFDHVKETFWITFLLSGGFICIRYPKFMIGLIPIILLKMFNDNATKWSINLHYSIEIVPIIVFAFYYFVSKLKSSYRIYASVIGALLCAITSVKVVGRDSMFYNESRCNIYDKRHYDHVVDNENLNELLTEFQDPSLKISATSALVPRLALRDDIYTYPNIGTAEYIIINTKLMTWPIPSHKFKEEFTALNNSDDWLLLKKVDDTYVYKLRTELNTLNRVQFYNFH